MPPDSQPLLGQRNESAGVALIAAERERQVAMEGYTLEHDDEHTDGALAIAGAIYAMPYGHDWKAKRWPFSGEFRRQWVRSREDRVRELVKAGALLAAEIDRLQREAAGQGRRCVVSEPDLYEGNDEAREAVCDWGGHDWVDEIDGGAEVCTQCGAARTVPVVRQNDCACGAGCTDGICTAQELGDDLDSVGQKEKLG